MRLYIFIYSLKKKCIAILFVAFCSVPSAYAIDSMILTVAEITAKDWSLKNAKLTITQLNQDPQISLLSAILILPPPLKKLTSLSIQCKQFNWHENYLDCSAGRGHFKSKQFKALAFDFSLQVNNDKSKINIKHLSLWSGEISVGVQQIAEKWQIDIKAEDIDLVKLNAIFGADLFELTQGVVDFEVKLKGKQDTVQALLVAAQIKKLSVHDQEGSIASDNVMLKTQFSALKQQTGWQWRNTSSLLQGAVYVEPVYLEVDKKNTISVSANGFWQLEQQKVQVEQFKLAHADALSLHANARFNYQTEPSIEWADVSIHIPQLKSVVPIYLLPFLESSAFSAIELMGAVDAQFSIEQNSVSEANFVIKDLTLDDADKQFYINQANAEINWAKQQGNVQSSFINWQQLRIQAFPFQSGQLDFISFDKQLKLLKQADLAVLGGILSINNFSFSMPESNADATVYFDGSINQLSLEQLSKALGWTALSGTISGYIPSVRYQDKTLSLDGELKIQVFDGEVTIKNLASSGMFSDFSQFYTDIIFDHLDLDAITHKFDTGYIEGRLSGMVQNLYLENWQPVSFYAWIGTPEDDDSTHRISQKAVENIASIGGGGISDALSRGFLGLFSTFGYHKLGFGCYLHQGVCQLMGGEAVDNGFYLIEGSGLPRIDVIGYNTRLDWSVLLDSLSRIGASDEVIIE